MSNEEYKTGLATFIKNSEARHIDYKNMLEKSGKTYGDAPYELVDVDYTCSAFSTILRCPT